MRYDVIAPAAAGTTADPDWIAEWAQHVEHLGFSGITAFEHAVVFEDHVDPYPYTDDGRMDMPYDTDLPDPLDLLSFLAGCTTDLGLGTGVLVLPNHHPVVLAKRLATLSRLSRGRLLVGVGMGWLREEIAACGVDFDSRGRRANEQLEVIRKLWTGGPVDHEGEFFTFKQALSRPTPHSPIPIHIGGHTRAAARRAGRYADGIQPVGVHGEALTSLVRMMRDAAAETGRDPDALELTLGHQVDRVDLERAGRLRELGATRIVLVPSATTELARAKDELSACAERLELP